MKRRSTRANAALITMLLIVFGLHSPGQNQNQPSYNQLISSGYDLLKEGKPEPAYAAAMEAAQANDKRFEAYALAALALHAQGAETDAQIFVQKSLARAPIDKQPMLRRMSKMINDAKDNAPTPTESGLTVDARRQMDILQLIIEDADRTAIGNDRNKLLNDFLTKSESFVSQHPDQVNIWALRGAAALETGNQSAAVNAGLWLLALNQDRSTDLKLRKVLAMIDRKGWLLKTSADAQLRLGYDYATGSDGFPQKFADALKWYRLAASQGNAYAQSNIGFLYLNGQGVQKNAQEAAEWFKLSAERGYALAQEALANMYESGNGVPKDLSKSFRWYKAASEQGNAEAQNNLGALYDNGLGVGVDYAEAFRWLKAAADQGYAPAEKNLSVMYSKGRASTGYSLAKNPSEALRLAKSAAAKGESEAEELLGEFYRDGLVTQDFPEAFRWFKLAAEQGNAQSQVSLAALFESGSGVAPDHAQALKWLKAAAGQGYALAQFNLARTYTASSQAQDWSEGLKWAQASANQGFAEAQEFLGERYREGKIAQRNYAEALKWFRAAAEQGNVDAEINLAVLYLSGRGAPVSHNQAVNWLQAAAKQGYALPRYSVQFGLDKMFDNPGEKINWLKSLADQGYAPAQELLAEFYDHGTGVPQDYATAIKYHKLSADQGYAEAQVQLGYEYQDGHGTARDYRTALNLFQAAARQGNKAGKSAAQTLALYTAAMQKFENEAISRSRVANPAVMVGSVDVSRFGGVYYGDSIENVLKVLGLPPHAFVQLEAPENPDIQKVDPKKGGALGFSSLFRVEYDESHRVSQITALDLTKPVLETPDRRDTLTALLDGPAQLAIQKLGRPAETTDESNCTTGTWHFQIGGHPGKLEVSCVDEKTNHVSSISVYWQ